MKIKLSKMLSLIPRMKAVSLFLMFLPIITDAQSDTTFFNKNWEKTSKAEASFYRPAPIQLKGHYLVKDYYRTGVVQMSGSYKDLELKIKDGDFIYYYPDGVKESEGAYKANNKTGQWNRYFPQSGKLGIVANYQDSKYDVTYLDSSTGKKIITYSYLSPGEAISVANKLYSKKILSLKGHDTLLQRIKNNDLHRGILQDLVIGMRSEKPELSNISILNFLTEAYKKESYYRIGITEYQLLNNKLPKPAHDDAAAWEQYRIKIDEQQKLLAPYFKGPQIEQKIPAEDSVPNDAGYTTYPGFTADSVFGLVDTTRSLTGKTITRTAKDLHEIGIINDLVYTKLLAAIQNKTILKEDDAIAYAEYQMCYAGDYDWLKSKELKLAENLMNAGVISSTNFEALLLSYNPYELKESFGLLAFVSRSRYFHIDTSAPIAFYQNVFAQIGRIFPDFHYSNLKVEIRNNKDGQGASNDSMYQQDLVISFIADGREYSNTVLYDFVNLRKGSYLAKKSKIADGFYEGVNKWLTDRNSDERLYMARNIVRLPIELKETMFALLPMTQKQRNIWGEDALYNTMSLESHDNSFNTANIEKTIDELKRIGLFSHLTDAQVKQAKEHLRTVRISSMTDLLSQIPGVILNFDWETSNLKNPYQELTKQFSMISRGAFKPTQIIDNFEKDFKSKSTHFGFTLNDKTYIADLDMNGDWLDTRFWDLIRNAAEEQNINGDWYECSSNGQEAAYIFLTNAQYDYLSNHHPGIFGESF